jgi:hypothetical protein
MYSIPLSDYFFRLTPIELVILELGEADIELSQTIKRCGVDRD